MATHRLAWTDSRDIHLDVIMGRSYDFDGWDLLREESRGVAGNYAVWPSNGKWSVFRDSDGSLALERYRSEAEAKLCAERWDEQVCS